MSEDTLTAVRSSIGWPQEIERWVRRRTAVVGRRRASAARRGAEAGAGGAAGGVHPRPAQAATASSIVWRRCFGLRMFAIAAGYEDADDCDWLRHDPVFKMAVGLLPESGESSVLAAHHVAAGECAVEDRDRPADGGDGGSVLRQLSARAGVDHARYRRHARCGARPSTALAVQCALRRALLPADPHL